MINETLRCVQCGGEASTYKELATGKCRLCGGELEEEIEDESSERDLGYYDYGWRTQD